MHMGAADGGSALAVRRMGERAGAQGALQAIELVEVGGGQLVEPRLARTAGLTSRKRLASSLVLAERDAER